MKRGHTQSIFYTWFEIVKWSEFLKMSDSKLNTVI